MIEKISWKLYTKEYADLLISDKIRFIYFDRGDYLVTNSGVIKIEASGFGHYATCILFRVCLTQNFFLILGFKDLAIK